MEDWLTYLLIAAMIINVYLVSKKYFFRKPVKEGFVSESDGDNKQQTSVKDRPKAILDNTEPLHLGKMKQYCKQIYDNLHDNISYNMYTLVKDHGVEISKDPMDPQAQEKMKSFTVMRDFQQSLEESRQQLIKNAV